MRLRHLAALAATSLLVASCATPRSGENAPAEAAMGSLVISPDRIGPWAVGVTYAQMAETAPLKLQYSSETTGSADEQPTGRGCEFFTMAENWPGLGFMFEEGLLTRIDLYDPNSRTEEPDPIKAVTENGIKIGDTIAKARTAYGPAMTVSPHPYLEDAGSYLNVISTSGAKNGIIFETEGDIITSLRVGDKNSVQYIEGCL